MTAGTKTVHNSLDIVGERAGFLLDTVHAPLMLSVLLGQPVMIQLCDLVATMIIYQGSKYESIETLADIEIKSVFYSAI